MAEIVFFGDDFTGASDSLATYARQGLRARLVLAETPADKELDVLGIPTDLRSLAPDPALEEIARLWPRIAAAGPHFLHFKVCSTFDSAPRTGSIGAVTRELIGRFHPDIVAVIGGQPSLGRYCAFGNLFARGPDGATHRIDRHPVMSRHPVTPMTEADLRLHLAAQGLEGLQLVTTDQLNDPAAVLTALSNGPVLFDVMTVQDQKRIGSILRRAGGRQLLIGASSVAEILAPAQVASACPGPAAKPRSGNLLLFAGSRSQTSKAQVDAAQGYRKLPLASSAFASGSVAAEAETLLREGQPVLIHLLPEEDYGLSPGALADACAGLIDGLLKRVDVGFLGLAGGDTSSRICTRLGFDDLTFERELGKGVCICTASHGDPARDHMRLMLKGGQMGGTDLFDRFAEFAGYKPPVSV